MPNIALDTEFHNRQIDEKPAKTPVNSGKFTKRMLGLERFIAGAKLRDTYLVIQTWMNEKTRTCWPGIREIAARARISLATVRRHLRALERLGVIVTTFRRRSCRSNLTSVYFFPLLNDDFLRQRMSGGCAQNERVIQVPEIKEQTTTAREARREWKPDRETYRSRPRSSQPGARMTHLQAWRLKCGVASPSEATIGRYQGPKTETTPEEDAEIARVVREKERMAREQYDRRMGRR